MPWLPAGSAVCTKLCVPSEKGATTCPCGPTEATFHLVESSPSTPTGPRAWILPGRARAAVSWRHPRTGRPTRADADLGPEPKAEPVHKTRACVVENTRSVNLFGAAASSVLPAAAREIDACKYRAEEKLRSRDVLGDDGLGVPAAEAVNVFHGLLWHGTKGKQGARRHAMG